MIVQLTKRKLINAKLLWKLFYIKVIQSNEIPNKNRTNKTKRIETRQSETSPERRRKTECSLKNKNRNCIRKRPTEFGRVAFG